MRAYSIRCRAQKLSNTPLPISRLSLSATVTTSPPAVHIWADRLFHIHVHNVLTDYEGSLRSLSEHYLSEQDNVAASDKHRRQQASSIGIYDVQYTILEGARESAYLRQVNF